MSEIKEGSRETRRGIIISEAFDWCRSPTATIPYTIWAYQTDAADLANTVRQTDDRSHVVSSIVVECYGDEAGIGGGILSGTHNGTCTPKTWSETVRAESRNMVRHDDEWWMNDKNTWGRLSYLEDPKSYATPEVAVITPAMSGSTADAETASAEGSANLRGFVAVAPSAESGNTLRTPDPSTRPRPIPNAGGYRDHDGLVRISGGCDRQIGTYGQLRGKCGPGKEAHHVPPDWTMGLNRPSRTSDKDKRGVLDGETVGLDEDDQYSPGRIPNMPTFTGMPAICVQGRERDRNSEHYAAQKWTNGRVASLPAQDGMVRLGSVLDTSVKATTDSLRLSQACQDKLKDTVKNVFPEKYRNQLVRGSDRDPADQAKTMKWLMKDGGVTIYPPFEYWNSPN